MRQFAEVQWQNGNPQVPTGHCWYPRLCTGMGRVTNYESAKILVVSNTGHFAVCMVAGTTIQYSGSIGDPGLYPWQLVLPETFT